MKWMEALKAWNKSQPKWSIPKKDTEGYKAVRMLMDGETKAPKKTKATKAKKDDAKPKTTKATKNIVATLNELMGEVEPPKRKRGRPKKIME